ncbi:MAG: molybdopterin-dependent oxidoreductase, partial [Dehalococcoidia bacterium]
METKTTINCCPGNGCHEGCLHRTHVQDGKIVKVERLTYPDGEVGDICLKGAAGARLPYHPERLRYPLKRVGERGEGKWERITWEQALDEIADKLNHIRKKYRPESVLVMSHPNSVPHGETQIMLGERFRTLFGATSWTQGCAIDSNPYFAAYFTYGTCFGHWLDPRTLIEGKTKLIITWGCNPAEMSTRVWRYVRQAQKNGAKLVDIGLIKDPTAQGADWWIQVTPGSDGALALAMIDTIIMEKLYDEEYVAKYTNAPFLVRVDNGKLLRESDISSEGAAQNCVVWDTVSRQPKVMVPYVGGPEGIKPALTGTYAAGGIECKPVFQLLAEMAGEYSAERASGISGVPAETIRQLAREYAAAKPANMVIRNGLRYKNAGNAYRCMVILSALTGNIGVMGGGTMSTGGTQGQGNAPLLNLNDAAVRSPEGERAPIIPQAHLLQGMITGEPYPIKAMICYASNHLQAHANRQRWFEEILPNLDLVVVNDIFMTTTAEYADYVLPDCTLYERDDMDIGINGHITLLERAIEPMYECRPPIYFWSELARRLGLGEYFDKTIEEWIAVRLNSEDPSVAGIQPPLTVKRLKAEKMVRANVPEGLFLPWAPKMFPTPSGRLELYNEELLASGDALPVFQEQAESPRSSLAEKYPLAFITANNRYFIHTLYANDPEILKLYLKEPHLSINPEDARMRNISGGDLVKAYNDRGSLKVKALISETVPPGVVNIPNGWWPKQFIEVGHPANLIQPVSSLEFRD